MEANEFEELALHFEDYQVIYGAGIIRIMKGDEFISKDDTMILAHIVSGFLIEVMDNTEQQQCN